ncbi:MAG: diguanylate cyclase [Thiobacillus sp.]|nr:diguanylate cyclase [Thiobacillus sp.]
MNHRTGIPLSTFLLVAFLIIGFGATVAVRTVLENRQQRVVSQLGSQESRRTAEQIYQHLYSVMRKGWSRAELEETIARIAQVYPDIAIHLIRGEPVAGQYGDDAASAEARRSDPELAAALADGHTRLSETGTMLRYIMPMANHAECLACHSNSANSINGLLDIRIPSEKLRAPIQATLSPIPNLISLLIIAIFIVVFLLLRHQIVHPIVKLARRVTEMSHEIDNASGVAIKRTWPREIRLLAGQFNQMLKEVQNSHGRLVELAVRDKLTGLYNRRYFDEMLARTLDQAERSRQQISLLMLDLDRFKPINDRYGHAMGDKVLADVGKAIQALTRDGDISSRIGGDEFLIIAINCDVQNAAILAERLREGIGALAWQAEGQPIQVGVSIGVANYPGNAHTLDELLDYADQAMYVNKQERTARP